MTSAESEPGVRRRATIADVAREAGVSRTTVSHSLSGLGHVNSDTRQRVMDTAERLGYRPSVRAQRLRSGRSQAIAVLSSMPSAVSAGVSRLGFFTELAMGCAQTALLSGYTLVLTPPDQQNVLDRVDIDGAILLEPAPGDELARELTARGIPHITVGAAPGPNDVDLHGEESARLIFEHFAERGARAPGILLGSSERESQRAFRQHYVDLAARQGFAPVIASADEAGGEQAGRRETARMLAEHPEIDALCVPVDAFATGAVQAAEEAGRTVGRDLLVATRYDGVRAQTSSPPLTALDLHLTQVSDAAVTLLLSRLGGQADGKPITPPPPTLIARASTGA